MKLSQLAYRAQCYPNTWELAVYKAGTDAGGRNADEEPGSSPAGASARGQTRPGTGPLGSRDFVLREKGSPAWGSLEWGLEWLI